MKRFYLFLSVLLIASRMQAQTPEEFTSFLDEINGDSLRQTVTDLQNFGSRFCLRENGNKQVAEYIAQRLENYGITAAVDSFYVEDYFWLVGDYNCWFYNVKGILGPAQPSDSIVMIGAHLDAIATTPEYQLLPSCPGADDNASGVAVMIEMARIIQKYNLLPKHNIHFMAFDAEEIGLVGAYHDAETRAANNEKVVVMLNNDMVSYQPDDDWKLTLHWYDNSPDITQKAVEVCETYTDITPVILTGEDNDLRQNSDSYAYSQNDFKTIFAIENTFSDYYHTENDSVQWNNYDYHEHVARYNFAMLFNYGFADLQTLSISDNLMLSSFQMYPNPAKEYVTLQFNLTEQSEIQAVICDMTGKTVWQQPSQTYANGMNQIQLNCRNFANGIYFCSLDINHKKNTFKLLINH
ncbi:MAG: M20/M25/M40 family metallo-hydrolase [Bacteroidales bacterium]|nr:M20/M25/M40 family metallo-hydrolase [Bacteroidales bacterium]